MVLESDGLGSTTAIQLWSRMALVAGRQPAMEDVWIAVVLEAILMKLEAMRSVSTDKYPHTSKSLGGSTRALYYSLYPRPACSAL